ncbi:MAG: murein biosynthesis integral membrane protein MurJ, partial [Stagnimonas sp.]|nr:murein biosynthesis integral membrane protein MurJ [Stagnimonas sp.]
MSEFETPAPSPKPTAAQSPSLGRSTSIVGGMTLLSRVLGFVREIMLAAAFGAGAAMDAFLVALQIPNFGRRMFAEGAFSQAFVPVFTETKTLADHAAARDMVAVVSGTLGGVLSLVTLVGCLASPLLVWLFASGFADDPGKQVLAGELLRWTFPYLMFISLTSMAGGVLNTYGRFAVPAFTPVILNLCLIGSAFVDGGSVQVLAYAVFLAGVLQLAFQLPSLWQLRLLPRPRWAWSDGRVRRIVRLMGPVLVGSSIAQISLLINSNLSTHFGDGSVSWLYYANRLMEFPLG